MAKPPKIVVPGLNRGQGIPAGYILGRRRGTGHGPAELLDITQMKSLGLATSAQVAAVSSAVSALKNVVPPYLPDLDSGQDDYSIPTPNPGGGLSSLAGDVTGSPSATVVVSFGGGAAALVAKATGNIGIGASLPALTTGTYNLAIGGQALQAETTGSQNVAIGYQAGAAQNGANFNMFIGSQAGLKITTGADNTAIGCGALANETTGHHNTAIGENASTNQNGASFNMCFGFNCGFDLTTGSYNTIVGDSTGRGLTTGSNNTIVGRGVTGLPAALSGNIIFADGSGSIKAQFDGSHWVLAGTIPATTSSGTKFLRDDNTWAVPSGGSSAPATPPIILAWDTDGDSEPPMPVPGPPGATPISIGFIINSGATGTNVGPELPALRAGSFTKCKVVTKASDGATGLTFRIKKNGVDIFSADPTVAAGTAAGTLSTFTSLTSNPLSVAQDDIFTIDITSGTSSWQFTAVLE